jgi:uncharacterized protein (DUF2235 family)
MAGRNLVVFCDGTSNEVGTDHTNVLKLYRLCDRSDAQLAFYDPGVGTGGMASDWNPLSENVRLLLGLATGWGIDANILQAYDFLCQNYRDDDRIFLFGFSRGAYTARAVAGMIQMVGLLHPEQANLTGYGLTAYKSAARQDRLGIAGRFQRDLDSRHVPVHFLGVWDTVASVLVPRPDRLYLPTLETLPYTRSNPSVRAFRHALAIDERRSMFRPLEWRPDQQFRSHPFEGPAAVAQDAQTLWFAGTHCDVGGGHPEAESAPAKFALRWMAREAQAHGLFLREPLFGHVVEGKPLPGGRDRYARPDATAPLHNSLRSFWPMFEIVPKPGRHRRFPTPSRWPYLPLGEPRGIEAGASLHSSVIERIESTDYRPVNLPAAYAVVGDAVSAPATRRPRRPAQ